MKTHDNHSKIAASCLQNNFPNNAPIEMAKYKMPSEIQSESAKNVAERLPRIFQMHPELQSLLSVRQESASCNTTTSATFEPKGRD